MADKNCFDVETARTLISDPLYEVDEFIGAGAMACVYRVHERGTPNVYALKLLREQYSQRSQFLDFFEREAIHMRDLQYPNIVRFYKFVREEQSAYILMDYVEGKPLTDFVKESRASGMPLPIDKVVRIMAQVARAINYLHREGFIHRDIKPGNVLLAGVNQSAFLTDLGIVGASDEPALRGAGTPSYMPYEQQVAEAVDHTADIYAFAVMLFELFTSYKPFIPPAGMTFAESRGAMVELHRKGAIPSISEKRSDLPQALDSIFEQALAKDPKDRYLDVLDFAEDIHDVLQPLLSPDLKDFQSIEAQPIKRSAQIETISDAPTRNYRILIGGMALIILIAIFVAVGLFLNTQTLQQVVATIAETAEETEVLSSATFTSTATDTPTHTPTATFTPSPTAYLDDAEPLLLAEDSLAIGYGDNLNESLTYIAAVRDNFVPLRFSDNVNGFRVDMRIREASLAENQQFGIAFRIQGARNYLLFEVDVDESKWTLSVYEDDAVTEIDSAIFEEGIPTEISLSTQDEFIRIDYGEGLIQQEYEQWQTGTVSLWLPNDGDQVLALSSLAISFIGDEVDVASEFVDDNLPQFDRLHFLLEDIRSLRATANDTVIDCTEFVTLYARFDVHETIESASDFVVQVRLDSALIANRCQLESDNEALAISLSDVVDWENALDTIIADIEAQ